MTKAVRWGLGSLGMFGGVAFLMFAGCSSSSDTGTPPPADTGVADTGTTTDSTVTDSGTDETATDTGTGSETATETGGETGDAGPPGVDRKVTLVLGAPDLPPQFLCVVVFGPTDDPATSTTILGEIGPIGLPNASAPSGIGSTTGLPYGAVVPLNVNKGNDATAIQARAAFDSLQPVAFVVDTFPGAPGTGKSPCADTWKGASSPKATTGRWTAVKPGTVKTGDSWVAALGGCQGTGSATFGECGAGKNLGWHVAKADQTTPASFSPDGTGAKVGVQFLDLSEFAGTAGVIPGFQGIDVYVQSIKAAATDGGTGTPDGAAVKIATNVSFANVSGTPPALSAPIGLNVLDNPDDAVMLIAPTGGDPSCALAGGTPPTCKAYAIPLGLFFPKYKTGGGSDGTAPIGGFVDGTNQVIALTGSPLDTSASSTLRVMPATMTLGK